MRSVSWMVLTAILVIFVAESQADAFASTRVAAGHKCLFPHSRKRAPNWICNPQGDDWAMAALGSSPRTRAGVAFMEQMAAADARAHLAREMAPALQHQLAMRQPPELGAAQVRQDALMRLTDESLRDTRIVKRAYAPDGTLYVLVGLDAVQAQEKLNSVSSAYLDRKRP